MSTQRSNQYIRSQQLRLYTPKRDRCRDSRVFDHLVLPSLPPSVPRPANASFECGGSERGTTEEK